MLFHNLLSGLRGAGARPSKNHKASKLKKRKRKIAQASRRKNR
jgi:hypothetical protein